MLLRVLFPGVQCSGHKQSRVNNCENTTFLFSRSWCQVPPSDWNANRNSSYSRFAAFRLSNTSTAALHSHGLAASQRVQKHRWASGPILCCMLHARSARCLQAPSHGTAYTDPHGQGRAGGCYLDKISQDIAKNEFFDAIETAVAPPVNSDMYVFVAR